MWLDSAALLYVVSAHLSVTTGLKCLKVVVEWYNSFHVYNRGN